MTEPTTIASHYLSTFSRMPWIHLLNGGLEEVNDVYSRSPMQTYQEYGEDRAKADYSGVKLPNDPRLVITPENRSVVKQLDRAVRYWNNRAREGLILPRILLHHFQLGRELLGPSYSWIWSDRKTQVVIELPSTDDIYRALRGEHLG